MTGAEIRALARMLDRMSYYQLLRVAPEAQPPEIRSAFKEMRVRFHPDSFRKQEAEVHEAVDRIAKRLNEAFTILRDPKRRRVYDGGLERGELRYSATPEDERKSDAGAEGELTPNGRKFYKLYEEDLKRGDLVQALANLKMARTFERDNAHLKEKYEELQAKIPKPKKSSAYAIR
jgi:curved DNA-binding protein CbpA